MANLTNEPLKDTILEYGPTVFSRTVCLSQQCQALKAAQEGICEELDETLSRMHTSLPECAAEVNSDLCVNKCGHRCSVDNAVSRSFFLSHSLSNIDIIKKV